MRNRVVNLVLLTISVSGTSVALGQSGGGYDLTWSTIDSGGAMFSLGGSYELGGTIGQPDAGALSGGKYELGGGFWFGETGTPCVAAFDCVDDEANNACNHATCPGGECSYVCVRFGDAKSPPNGIINLNDILCVLAGFANINDCAEGDLQPCGGNALINLEDILGVLNAFGGANPCGCTENFSPGGGEAPLCGSSQP